MEKDTKKTSGKKERKKNNKKSKKTLLLFAVIIVLISIIFAKNNTIKKVTEMSFLVNNENIISNLKNEVIIKNSVIYISLEDIKKYFDEDLYQEDNKIILSSSKKIAAIELEKDQIEINGSTIKTQGKAYKTEQNIIYLPISDLQNVYDMECTYNSDYNNIVIDYNSKKLEKANTTKNVLLKEKPGIFVDNLEKIEKGSEVVYISEENGWAKIRSQNGNIGYINKNKLTNFITEREDFQENNNLLENEFFEKNITNENIKKYSNRKELIEKILLEAVSKKKNSVKIIYKKDKNAENFKRFEVECKAILEECGISITIE